MKTQDFLQATLGGIAETTQMAEDGEHDVLDAIAAIRQVKDMADAAYRQLLPQAVDELEKYGEPVERAGVRLEYVKGGRRWSYDHIAQWNEHKEAIKAIEQQAKSIAESGLQGLTEDGELVEGARFTFSSDTLKISKAK